MPAYYCLKKLFLAWLDGENRCYCDTMGALGCEKHLSHPKVRSVNASAGRIRQVFQRFSSKIINDILEYNRGCNVS